MFMLFGGVDHDDCWFVKTINTDDCAESVVCSLLFLKFLSFPLFSYVFI